jgi:predicted glycoside hydrolase/deacetylase ChbG (UPF0249 family)
MGTSNCQRKGSGLVNKNGFLYSAVDSVYRSASAPEVEEEIRNQVIRSKQFGIDPTHLDAHMGHSAATARLFKSLFENRA